MHYPWDFKMNLMKYKKQKILARYLPGKHWWREVAHSLRWKVTIYHMNHKQLMYQDLSILRLMLTYFWPCKHLPPNRQLPTRWQSIELKDKVIKGRNQNNLFCVFLGLLIRKGSITLFSFLCSSVLSNQTKQTNKSLN